MFAFLMGLLAAISPLVLAASLLFLLSKKYRPIAKLSLLAGAALGVALSIGWWVPITLLDGYRPPNWQGLAMTFGCGYTLGAGIVGILGKRGNHPPIAA